jgi:hypothetical protein
MGFYLYFYLVLVGYLILFGAKIVGGLLLLLQLQMVLGNEVQRIVLMWHCLLQILLILTVQLPFLHMG